MNEPKCNINESRINIDNEKDYERIYEESMDDCQYI